MASLAKIQSIANQIAQEMSDASILATRPALRLHTYTLPRHFGVYASVSPRLMTSEPAWTSLRGGLGALARNLPVAPRMHSPRGSYSLLRRRLLHCCNIHPLDMYMLLPSCLTQRTKFRPIGLCWAFYRFLPVPWLCVRSGACGSHT